MCVQIVKLLIVFKHHVSYIDQTYVNACFMNDGIGIKLVSILLQK